MGNVLKRVLGIVTTGIILITPFLTAENASAVTQVTLYVANSGTSHDEPGYGTNASCSHAYLTINYAIEQAGAGDTVLVCPGTYAEEVLVDKGIILQGISHPVIDPGITRIALTVAANDITVRGLTLQDSFAGIDVEGAEHALITGNTARTSLIGINVERSANSSITGNVVNGNLCFGISLFALGQQENAHVAVTANQVENNVSARCLKPSPGFSVQLQGLPGGIVLGAQSGGEIAGNLVSRNVVLDNGDNGTLPGAGIVLEVPFGISFTGISPVHSVLYREAAEMRPRNGAPVASGSVSGNMVVGNLISRNGLPGVTVLNASPPGLADLSGDMVDRNVIERNNAEGLVIRPSMAGPAPGALVRNLGLSVADRQATGVLVASGSPLTIEVSSNTVVGDYFGVWLSPAVSAPTAIFNQFIGVPVPVFRSPV